MGTIPRPRIVSRSTDLEADDLPEQVTITVRELAGAVKQGLLAPVGWRGAGCRARAVRSRGNSTGRSERRSVCRTLSTETTRLYLHLAPVELRAKIRAATAGLDAHLG